ncbi:MAG: Uncharacterized protein XE09_0039 [Atribacteria bacterium 34_868]|nr:MAG: Uncharacterized protein XE09_0039 [Atribacteria bacterium 34_868]HAJ33178.1 amidohydrolase [Candidatus Atribacteria bacterium]
MDLDSYKRNICKIIDENKEELISIGEKILKNPELGFKEGETAKLIKETLEKIGVKYKDKLALTGIKANIPGRKKSPNIAILGEMDAVISPNHPFADKKTGAAHACGHNTMITNLLGVGWGLINSGVMKDLEGSVTLFAVPAEEYIEIEYRKKLREEGKIAFLGGKQELIRLGEFDDIDMAMMFHPAPNTPKRVIYPNISMNGFIGKMVRYIGKSSHAGAAPEKGINALSAAMLGLQAINSLRETFKDDDCIRVHPIITKGGEGVNVVPSEVKIESYVRAKSMDILIETNKKINRALEAGAMAMGCNIEIDDLPGYMPIIPNDIMTKIFINNATKIVGKENVYEMHIHNTGSSDMGDVTQIMPGIHPMTAGFEGELHSKDFKIIDKEMAYIIPAKIIAMTIIDLLSNNADLAKQVLKEKKKSKEKYLNEINNMAKTTKKEYMKI